MAQDNPDCFFLRYLAHGVNFGYEICLDRLLYWQSNRRDISQQTWRPQNFLVLAHHIPSQCHSRVFSICNGTENSSLSVLFFWCSIPEVATNEASVSRTNMSFSVGMSCTGASQISSRFVFYQRLLEPFHSTRFSPFDHFFCITFQFSLYNSQILRSSSVACLSWGPYMTAGFPPHQNQNPAPIHVYQPSCPGSFSSFSMLFTWVIHKRNYKVCC